MTPVTRGRSWQDLAKHADDLAGLKLNTLFSDDSSRAGKFTLGDDDLLVDISRQKITEETLSLLYALARERNLESSIQDLISGNRVNVTENRPALHTALRSDEQDLTVDGINIMEDVRAGLGKMAEFVEEIHAGRICGATGKKFRTIINLGIGGSDLGPRLTVHALHSFCRDDIDVRFVANVDYQDLHKRLKNTDPETTLFIVASKSFTTLETLANARSAQQWLLEHGCPAPTDHFIAVTANPSAARDSDIQPGGILEFREWVGGRFSLWSTIGLPIALGAGMDIFMELLRGARAMDRHFATAPLDQNIPVTLALTDIWNSNFLGAESLAVVPYDHSLALLPAYLSQLMMESNGKRTTTAGADPDYHTGMIIWGAEGTNAQHAFFQLLHQGTRTIPVEFLVGIHSTAGHPEHQVSVVANCLAQAEALMLGRAKRDNEPWRNFPGNRQSTTIMYDSLTPYRLGQLLAMYEHRTFVQACLWDINAFDQWGVELGKELAAVIINEIESGAAGADHDSSTRQLIEHYLRKRK